jgi:hypothetical protein
VQDERVRKVVQDMGAGHRTGAPRLLYQHCIAIPALGRGRWTENAVAGDVQSQRRRERESVAGTVLLTLPRN